MVWNGPATSRSMPVNEPTPVSDLLAGVAHEVDLDRAVDLDVGAGRRGGDEGEAGQRRRRRRRRRARPARGPGPGPGWRRVAPATVVGEAADQLDRRAGGDEQDGAGGAGDEAVGSGDGGEAPFAEVHAGPPEGVEGVGHLGGGAEPGREVGVEAAPDQLGLGVGERRVEGGWRGQHPADGQQRVAGGQVAVHARAGEDPVEGDAEGPDVGGPRRPLAPHDGGVEVLDRADGAEAGDGLARGQHLHQAEVGQLGAVVGQQDVGRLDVAVGDARLVQVVGGPGGGRHGGDGTLRASPPGRGTPASPPGQYSMA